MFASPVCSDWNVNVGRCANPECDGKTCAHYIAASNWKRAVENICPRCGCQGDQIRDDELRLRYCAKCQQNFEVGEE